MDKRSSLDSILFMLFHDCRRVLYFIAPIMNHFASKESVDISGDNVCRRFLVRHFLRYTSELCIKCPGGTNPSGLNLRQPASSTDDGYLGFSRSPEQPLYLCGGTMLQSQHGFILAIVGLCCASVSGALNAGSCSINFPGSGSSRAKTAAVDAYGQKVWNSTVFRDEPMLVEFIFAKWVGAGAGPSGATATFQVADWSIPAGARKIATVGQEVSYPPNPNLYAPWNARVTPPAGGWTVTSTSNPAWRYYAIVRWDDETVVPTAEKYTATNGHIVTP
jgi:hypothetical protein